MLMFKVILLNIRSLEKDAFETGMIGFKIRISDIVSTQVINCGSFIVLVSYNFLHKSFNYSLISEAIVMLNRPTSENTGIQI